MGGVAFQQFFILVFCLFAIQFHQTILQQVRQGVEGASSALPLLYAIYAVLLLITVGTVHRSPCILYQPEQVLMFNCVGENCLPSLRVRAGIPERDS